MAVPRLQVALKSDTGNQSYRILETESPLHTSASPNRFGQVLEDIKCPVSVGRVATFAIEPAKYLLISRSKLFLLIESATLKGFQLLAVVASVSIVDGRVF